MDTPQIEPVAQTKPLTMKQMWVKAEAVFLENTGTSLRSGSKRSLEDCTNQIARRQLPADAKDVPEKVSGLAKSKELGIDMLRCLKLLGGVAAQGADLAFPPASLCFNAISLLLDIPADLHEFHGAVDGLFEKLGPGLSIFRIYQNLEQFNKLDDELNYAIHNLLMSFVKICGLSIKLRQSRKWASFKVEAKLILLHKDSGVRDEIEHFENLMSAHSAIQGTQTLKTLLQSNDLIVQVKDSDDKRRSEDAGKKNLELIKQRLGLKDKTFAEASRDLLNKFWRERLTGTASWIETRGEHEEFSRWADKKDSTIVACYFFPTLSGKTETDNEPVKTPLKCLAIQLAEKDSSYAGNLAKRCKDKSDIDQFVKNTTCPVLWDFLRLGAPEGKTSYFLVIDGLGALPYKYHSSAKELFGILNKLSIASRSVRALVSLRPGEHELRLDGSVCWDMNVGVTSEKDIAAYIDDDFEKENIFQDDNVFRTEMRNKIRDRLSRDLGGNYYKVRTALGRIKAIVHTSGKESDIEKVLNESNEDEASISRAIIRDMEESLTVDKINELNELLVWVGYACMGTLTFDQLDAALFFRFKTHPMVKLKKKLAGKYSKLLELSGNSASIREGMLDVVRKERTGSRGEEEEVKFSLELTITKANVTSVQHFLWSLAMKVSQDNFNFQKLEDKAVIKGSIQVNEFDAYLTVLRRTFALLDEDPTTATKEILTHLLTYLADHLDRLRKAPTSQPLTSAEQKEIGQLVYSLFSTGDVIKRHWGSCDEIFWCCEQYGLNMILEWLKDPDLVCGRGTRDHVWLKGVLAFWRAVTLVALFSSTP